jgi:hypothetical protein
MKRKTRELMLAHRHRVSIEGIADLCGHSAYLHADNRP